MKRITTITSILAIILVGGLFGYRYLPGLWPAIGPAPDGIGDGNTTSIPLSIPPGFSIEIFADNVPGARVIAFDVSSMWVSQTSEGTITEIYIENGEFNGKGLVLKNLNKPHGIAVDWENDVRYIAEEHRIARITQLPTFHAPEGILEPIADLPSGNGHYTRTIKFGPDNRLYVSVGSSCNVCLESDDRRAKIFTVDTAKKTMTEFARGLRNTVFFTWHPKTGQMWGTDMGRDLLGDDVPPDEINILGIGSPSTGSGQNSPSANFGWPICYGQNIHDTEFDKNTYIRNPCMEPFEMPSTIDVPAHSAPLGLAFIPWDSMWWPEDYRGDLIVAYHGSWNRSDPTGYKLVRHKFSPSGTYEGVEDFVTGWLTPQGALGRPVDVVFGPDHNLYVSDDKVGVVYRICPPPGEPPYDKRIPRLCDGSFD
ncbi:MAG: PQQ-dependent sugar dehydrogenase [Patescibacteria group bacterium]